LWEKRGVYQGGGPEETGTRTKRMIKRGIKIIMMGTIWKKERQKEVAQGRKVAKGTGKSK